eukprot:scaffold318_cov96-Skeletonema_dohrnii-CCMP3373.AAC.5
MVPNLRADHGTDHLRKHSWTMRCYLVVYLDHQRICISCDHTDTLSRGFELQHLACSTWHAALGMQHSACSTSACSTSACSTRQSENTVVQSFDAHDVIREIERFLFPIRVAKGIPTPDLLIESHRPFIGTTWV